MLAMDLVPLYPKALYQSPSSPLHFLLDLRALYASLSHDPFFPPISPTSSSSSSSSSHGGHEPWFQSFVYLEAAVQFPLALYLVSTLASSSSSSGTASKAVRTELAALVFGSVTGTTSVACVYHLWSLAEDVLDAGSKAMLVYGEYLPFAVVSALMAADMWLRLENRLGATAAKTQKRQ
ncbi:hypothetical protein N3K66_008970 [Trichothecium roseum]|uniref:Uncharacterized protein n=1 Tax=Trichothecium roseum TaxID=47278 RepID=A0ACC0UQP8_9HYPO|nr:hypothetical protein N3K66_008970 [Trichothecium roseum]